MAMTEQEIETRLAELGHELPEAAAPVASYVPVVLSGGVAHVSGQLPYVNGVLVTGQLGEDVSFDEGLAAAHVCGLMILAQLKAALGSLDRVERIIKLGVFVNSSAEFIDQRGVRAAQQVRYLHNRATQIELMTPTSGEQPRRSACAFPARYFQQDVYVLFRQFIHVTTLGPSPQAIYRRDRT